MAYMLSVLIKQIGGKISESVGGLHLTPISKTVRLLEHSLIQRDITTQGISLVLVGYPYLIHWIIMVLLVLPMAWAADLSLDLMTPTPLRLTPQVLTGSAVSMAR